MPKKKTDETWGKMVNDNWRDPELCERRPGEERPSGMFEPSDPVYPRDWIDLLKIS